MKKRKGLLAAWCTFGICVVLFLISTKFYHDHKRKADAFCYSCCFRIDESTLENTKTAEELETVPRSKFKKVVKPLSKTESEKQPVKIEEHMHARQSSASGKGSRASELSQKMEGLCSENAFLGHSELYERLPCGYVPRISPDGLRVCDVYSARFSEKSKTTIQEERGDLRKLCLIILLDSDTDPNYLINVIHRLEALGNSKVTFIVPHYLSHLSENVKAIITAGHELFIQIPTQTSIPVKAQVTIAPFLANMSTERLVDKLHELLASTKYAVGVANITPTLLTKSIGVMTVILDELTRRGLIFLDLEQQNEVIQQISEANRDCLYVNASRKFSKGMSVREMFNGDNGGVSFDNKSSLVVSINDVPEFLKMVTKSEKKFVFAPISSCIKNSHD